MRTFEESVTAAKAYAKKLGLAPGISPVVLGPEGGGQVLVFPGAAGKNIDTTVSGSGGFGISWLNMAALNKGGAGSPYNGNIGGDSRTWFSDEPTHCFQGGRERIFQNWGVPEQWDLTRYDVTHLDNAKREDDSITMQTSEPVRWTDYYGEKLALNVIKKVSLARHPFGPSPGLQDHFKTEELRHVGYRCEIIATNVGEKDVSLDNHNAAALWVLGQFQPREKTFWIAPLIKGEGSCYLDYRFFRNQPMAEGRAFVREDYFIKPVDGKSKEKWGILLERYSDRVGFIDLGAEELVVISYMVRGRKDVRILRQSWDESSTTAEDYAEKALHPQRPIADGYCDGPEEPGGPTLGGFFEVEMLGAYKKIPIGDRISLDYKFDRYRGPAELLLKVAKTKEGFGIDLRKEALLR